MRLTVKQAEPASPSSPPAASPLPSIEVKPTVAPGKLPAGSPSRTNYSRVNTAVPPAPDAGAEAQKSMAPRGAEMLPHKVASFSNEESMGTMTERPRLQDMVKAAMANSVGRMDINAEAARQAATMWEKTADDDHDDHEDKKDPKGKKDEKKEASATYALKLASAVEFIVDTLGKQASFVEGPPGVSEMNLSETFPAHQGQGHHQPPMHPGLQKGLKTEQSPTQLANDLEHTPGGSERMVQTNYGKTAASLSSMARGVGSAITGKQWKSGRKALTHGAEQIGHGEAQIARGAAAHAAQEGRFKGFERVIPEKFRNDAFAASKGEMEHGAATRALGEVLVSRAKKDISSGRAKTLGTYGGAAATGAGVGVHLGVNHHRKKHGSVVGLIRKTAATKEAISQGGLSKYVRGAAAKASGMRNQEFSQKMEGNMNRLLDKAHKAHVAGDTKKFFHASKGLDLASTASNVADEVTKRGSVVRSIREKLAEDAINPAKISAGAAVPPESSASGESGGRPAGGPPQGPTSLIGSNESARHYKRNAAYTNRKQDLKKYFDEPAMSSATDTTLQHAFAHTGEAGTKFGSAELSVKTAAAKALIAKLTEETAAASTAQRSA